MKAEERSGNFKRFSSQIKSHIEETFSKYNQEVEKRNEQQIGGILHKNDKSQKIYTALQDIARQLKSIQKELQTCDKLRKERRDLYSKKTTKYLNAVNQLVQDKSIRIKINPHVEKLAVKAKDNVAEVEESLRKFKIESLALCGKSYDYKPMIEQAFLQMAEIGFLWDNLGHFESVTNESVKEIFLPIPYKNSDAQKLEGQLMRIWNDIIKTLEQYEKPQSMPMPIQTQTKIIKSQLQMAHQYLFGFTRPQEVAKAIEIYQKQALKSASDPVVFNVLGILHEQGKGFQKDMNKAFKYFMRSAQKGDPEGLYKVGQYLEKGLLNFKQYFDGLYANRDAQVRAGIQYYEKAAAKGHLDALTDLGFIYEKGVIHDSGIEYFIEPHPDHAKKYYEKAKDKNFPRAYNNLGNLLICENASSASHLEGTTNLQKGIKYLNKARQLGCAKASLNLGKCYLSGTGVPLNLQKGRSLLKQAAQLGEIQGRLEYLRSYIGTNLEEQSTMNELVDTVRTVLIDNRKNPQALYLMALLQQKGIGVAANKEASYHYMASAARLEYPPALTRLGDYHYSGYHVDKNYENAKLLYEKAAEKDDSQAYLNLALMLEKGLLPTGTALGTVHQLYQRAEQLGNTNVLLLKGLKKPVSLSNNDQVIRAAQRGNYSALKLLSLNQGTKLSSFFQSSSPQMKKLSTFYVKQTFPSKISFNSQIS